MQPPEPVTVDETTQLRRALLLAAVATILRPTNLLIWMALATMICLRWSSRERRIQLPRLQKNVIASLPLPSMSPGTRRYQINLLVESLIRGSIVLFLSLLVDRWYYSVWTFPPLKFVYFNVVQSLSVFYGVNDWHYYISQGFPLLLTTVMPFALIGIYRGIVSTKYALVLADTILAQLATVSLLVPALLSLISHKEVRFIYPLLPMLHILAAAPLDEFFMPAFHYRPRLRLRNRLALSRRVLFVCLAVANAAIAIYTSTVHNRGVIDVLHYIRREFESFERHERQFALSAEEPSDRTIDPSLTVAFLMPCHSTPWRSHLIHSDIHAWALTCEPPLHLAAFPEARKSYMDEADIFYADPLLWLRENMAGDWPGFSGSAGPHQQYLQYRGDYSMISAQTRASRKYWPDYLVFFAQLEPTMRLATGKLPDQVTEKSDGKGYQECWRGFNSHWHDDWRRQGDVIVWCLSPVVKQNRNDSSYDISSGAPKR